MEARKFPLARTTVVAAAALLLLGSCATVRPWSPDFGAKAPRLDGFGRLDIPITTAVPAARAWFNAGVLQAYAFNEAEAVRMFKAALAQDPACAMCAWGVAWQLGPNINDHGRDNVSEAVKYVDYALRHLGNATPRERALVESLALRYAHASTARETAPLLGATCGERKDGEEKANPLDVAYADRMRALADTHPGDPDILSLHAEAEYIATEGDHLWDAAGKPNGRAAEVTARIERLLPAHPEHTGLNHYLVHYVDAVSVAPRAVAAADRLGRLAPKSPHLVHMSGHTYVHVGRYGDAVRVNDAALAADAALAEAQKAQGFSVNKDWRGHNTHFLWYAAVMAGREDDALRAADLMAADMGTADNNFAEYVRSLRLVTLVRMERWDRVLTEPPGKGERGHAKVWHAHAQGVAHARLGQLAQAQAALARLQPLAADLRQKNAGNRGGQKNLRSLLDVAEGRLVAEIALAGKKHGDALARQSEVVKAAVRVDQREPPWLGDGMRLTLGQMQAAAGQWKEAEASYRQALAEHPQSGWALRGLAQALQAQGRGADAAGVRRELERSWRGASPHLLTLS